MALLIQNTSSNLTNPYFFDIFKTPSAFGFSPPIKIYWAPLNHLVSFGNANWRASSSSLRGADFDIFRMVGSLCSAGSRVNVESELGNRRDFELSIRCFFWGGAFTTVFSAYNKDCLFLLVPFCVIKSDIKQQGFITDYKISTYGGLFVLITS